MNSKIKILDLDSKNTWHPDFKKLIFDQENWLHVINETSGTKSVGEFFSQITCTTNYLVNPLARQLREIGSEIVSKNYSGLVGYHGCCPENKETYEEKGVCPSDTSALIEKAREWFSDFPGFEEALKDIPSSYLEHNEGKVWFLMSAIWAKNGNSHHTKGSELISALANRLDMKAREIFRSKGTPTIIKCIIPFDWVEKDTISLYASCVLKELIRAKLWPREKFDGFSGGFSVDRVIPAENILEFIDMSAFVVEDEE
jgi:hypothetical protein